MCSSSDALLGAAGRGKAVGKLEFWWEKAVEQAGGGGGRGAFHAGTPGAAGVLFLLARRLVMERK